MTPRSKNRRRIWLFSLGNAIIMLVIAYTWLSLPYTFGDEAFLIKWSSLIKKTLFGFDAKPNPEEVLFVDVAANKTTIPTINEFGEVSNFHRKIITDRQELAQLFAMINRHHSAVRLVVCDVLFEDSTRFDQALEAELQQLGNKVLGVSHLTKDGEYVRPIFDFPYAPATYTATQGMFLKFPLLLQDTLPTIPLAMYQRLNGAAYQRKGPLLWVNNRLSLPSPIVDFKVRNADFRTGTDLSKSNYAIYNLGTLLESQEFMTDADQAQFFQGKIIMIGDFADDLHNTPFGKTPGLLLLYNAYLTLVSRQNVISIAWIFYLVLAFTFISYRVLSDVRVLKPQWLVKIFTSRLGTFILNALDEVFLLTLITLLSYFLFNIHINILILLLYVKAVEFFWKRINKFQNNPSPDVTGVRAPN